MAKLTGETITDKQIRELRDATQREASTLFSQYGAANRYDRLARLTAANYSARVALAERRARRGDNRTKARARCAEILNARAGAKP